MGNFPQVVGEIAFKRDEIEQMNTEWVNLTRGGENQSLSRGCLQVALRRVNSIFQAWGL